MSSKSKNKHHRRTGEGFNLIIRRMSGGTDSFIRWEHIVDALIVGAITFFALLLGGSLPEIVFGDGEYITLSIILDRLATAFLAFFLTFFAQWARYRGVIALQILNGD